MTPALPAPARFRALGGDVFEATFPLPPDYPGFRGHFPGEPVLPGMCHVALALRAAEAAVGRPLRLLRVDRARFSRKTLPGADLVIRLARRGGAGDAFHTEHFQGGEAVAELRFAVRWSGDPAAAR